MIGNIDLETRGLYGYQENTKKYCFHKPEENENEVIMMPHLEASDLSCKLLITNGL